jgi:hypothetical protein
VRPNVAQVRCFFAAYPRQPDSQRGRKIDGQNSQVRSGIRPLHWGAIGFPRDFYLGPDVDGAHIEGLPFVIGDIHEIAKFVLVKVTHRKQVRSKQGLNSRKLTKAEIGPGL